MRHECRVIVDEVVGRNHRHERVGVVPRNPVGGEQDLGRRPAVGGLEQQRVRRVAGQVPREIARRGGDHHCPVGIDPAATRSSVC
jgi:hypothetical protein